MKYFSMLFIGDNDIALHTRYEKKRELTSIS